MDLSSLDLSSIDPALLVRVDRLVSSVSWGAGAIVAAVAIKIGAPGLARILVALRKGQP